MPIANENSGLLANLCLAVNDKGKLLNFYYSRKM
jgi:hypothetical protein